jgi:hypothetical protein
MLPAVLQCYKIYVACFFVQIRNMHFDIIKVSYPPTYAQVIVLKNNIKIYIKKSILI